MSGGAEYLRVIRKKLVSRHFSGPQNLKVARTSWENIWNVDVNMSHMRSSRVFMDPEINSLPTQIKGL